MFFPIMMSPWCWNPRLDLVKKLERFSRSAGQSRRRWYLPSWVARWVARSTRMSDSPVSR